MHSIEQYASTETASISQFKNNFETGHLQYGSQTESSPQTETVFLDSTHNRNAIDLLPEVYTILD